MKIISRRNPLNLIGVLTLAFIASPALDVLAQTSKPQLECLVERSRSVRIEGGDFDDRTERVCLDVTITNKNWSQPAGDLRGTIYIFGESVHDRKACKLLQKETFPFDLEKRGSFKTTTPEVELKWDKTGASFGDKYRGWVLRVESASGELVIEEKSSPFIGDTSDLPLLKTGSYSDKNCRPVPEPKRKY